jgi:hypothetical protein
MAGQPTLFDDHILDETREYLSTYDTLIPTMAGLSLHLGVSKQSLYAWDKATSHKDGLVADEIYSQFSELLDNLRAEAENKLIMNGLTGDYNAAITKLMLTKHGYSDKQQQEVSGIDGNPIEVDHHWTIEVVE